MQVKQLFLILTILSTISNSKAPPRIEIERVGILEHGGTQAELISEELSRLIEKFDNKVSSSSSKAGTSS